MLPNLFHQTFNNIMHACLKVKTKSNTKPFTVNLAMYPDKI